MHPRPAIMVVDDEIGIRALLVEWLAEDGYRVHEAPDPETALVTIEATPEIELMLTDVVMPGGLNGFDLARRARVSRPNLKVIFVSAYSMAEAVAQARPLADPMLRKPFRHEQLMGQVRRSLGAAQAS